MDLTNFKLTRFYYSIFMKLSSSSEVRNSWPNSTVNVNSFQVWYLCTIKYPVTVIDRARGHATFPKEFLRFTTFSSLSTTTPQLHGVHSISITLLYKYVYTKIKSLIRLICFSNNLLFLQTQPFFSPN